MTVPEIRIEERPQPDKSKKHFFVQGTIEVEVFPNDVIPSIDSIDRLPAGKWTEFAVQNGLPCDPLDRKLLKPPLQGIIQLAWHRHFKGTVSERLEMNQERRIETYKQDLEHLKLINSTPAQKIMRSRDPKAPTTTPTKQTFGWLYRLRDETALTWSQYTSQKGFIVAVMVAAGAVQAQGKAITKDAIVNALRGKLNTKQPEERVVGFYLSEWQKLGIIERVDTGVEKVEAAPEGWEEGVQTKEAVEQIKSEAAGNKPAEAGPSPTVPSAKKSTKKAAKKPEPVNA